MLFCDACLCRLQPGFNAWVEALGLCKDELAGGQLMGRLLMGPC